MKTNTINRKQNLHKIIVDTGPLLVWLTLNFVKGRNFDEKVKVVHSVYSDVTMLKNSINDLESFFKNSTEIITTPHVIGELIGLVKSKLGFTKEQEYEFWDISIDFLSKMQLNEELITLVELYNEKSFQSLIPKIGFVDTELIKLSQKLNIPILSIDKRTLKVEAEKKNVAVLILQDDIYLYLN